MGIIDILQQYTMARKAQTFALGTVMDKGKLSIINPPEYGERFRKLFQACSI